MAEYKPVYEPFDLGEIDERYAGQSLPILRNPTRRFRREFVTSQGDPYFNNVAFILGVERDQVNALLDELEDTVSTFLFLGVWEKDGLKQLPHVYKIWDAWAGERAKEYATR